MNERDAFKSWHAEQQRVLRYKQFLRKCMRDLELIEDAMHTQIAEELATTRAGRKVLHAFHGHTMYGWECACGTDGRLKKLARTVGWEKFHKIIQLARRMETW